MSLGLIHVRGNICKYESVAAGNRRAAGKAGKFVRCVKAGKRGYKVSTAKGATKAKKSSSGAGRTGCIERQQKLFGQKKASCRRICWQNGRIASNSPCSGK